METTTISFYLFFRCLNSLCLLSLKNSHPCRDLNLGPPWYQADMLLIELSWLGFFVGALFQILVASPMNVFSVIGSCCWKYLPLGFIFNQFTIFHECNFVIGFWVCDVIYHFPNFILIFGLFYSLIVVFETVFSNSLFTLFLSLRVLNYSFRWGAFTCIFSCHVSFSYQFLGFYLRFQIYAGFWSWWS